MSQFKYHAKATLDLAFPVIIGQLGYILMGVVDNLMVGKLGASYLAASSFANGLFIFVLVIGIGVSFAITPLVAIAVGAENHQECGVIFRQSLLVNLTIGILLFLSVFICSNYIGLFHQPKEVVVLAAPYLRLLAFSILPVMIFQTYKQFIEGLSFVRPAMLITLFANIVNWFVNWVLIYGNLGFPKLELNGAGLATFISRLFMAAVLMYYVMSNKSFKEYDVSFHFKSLNYNVIKKILHLGIPSAVQYIFEVGAFSFAVVMIGWLGTKQLAAHQIAINLASISFMAAIGVSTAGGIRVGNALGKGSVREIRYAGFTAIFVAIFMMSIAGIIFITFRNYLPTLYLDDPQVIPIASSLLVIAAIFQVFDGTQAVGIGILRGLTDVKIPTLITFVAYWIIALPSAYLFGFILNMQAVGVWIGLLLGLTTSAILLTTRFNFKSKRPNDIAG